MCERLKQIGDKTAQGEFYIVKVKIFSDAKQATLRLLEDKSEVTDDEGGRIYARREMAERLLPSSRRFYKSGCCGGRKF